jgi:hypothetical protein
MLASKTRFPLIAAGLATVLAVMPANAAVPTRGEAVLGAPQGPGATVVVRNDHALNVAVYAVAEDGRRFRLGEVHRNSGRTFRLPARLSYGDTAFRIKVYSFRDRGAFSTLIDYVQGIKSRPLFATPGERINVILNNPLTESIVDYQ